ncbi:MAG TPA: DUF4131 domain-containing protein, partial [Halothiobacillaceae bacterium]|nr:DUF4131 domain-containing protein [Halothiobacillaceae bacterium]
MPNVILHSVRLLVVALVVGYLSAWFLPWIPRADVVSQQSWWITLLSMPSKWITVAPVWLLGLLAVFVIAGTFFAANRWVSMLAAFVLGLLWGLWQVADRVQNVAVLDDRVDCQVVGTITGLVDVKSDRLRFNLKPERIEPVKPNVESCPPAAGLLRVSLYHPTTDLKSGMQIAATLRLRPNHGLANPGGFDYPRWLFRHQIIATGYLHEDTLTVLGAGDGVMALVDRGRDYLARRLEQALLESPGATDKPDGAALLAGLSIGDRQKLSDA